MTEEINAASIQKHLDIKEIKNDVVVLKNGGLRAILMTSSINFALKSEDERKAIIYQFQDFLNSLDFSIQILVTSRKFNIQPYIQMIEEKRVEQTNELLRMQTDEYIEFVQSLTEITNIMTESFFLVVPYSSSKVRTQGLLKKISPFSKSKDQENNSPSSDFEGLKTELWQRVEFVTTTLRSAGVRSTPLKTEELIELFYKLYNPGTREDEELERAKEMRLK